MPAYKREPLRVEFNQNKVSNLVSEDVINNIHLKHVTGGPLSDAKFINDIADHLWSKEELKLRSAKGMKSKLHKAFPAKQPALPRKIDFIFEKLQQRAKLENDANFWRVSRTRINNILNRRMSNLRRKKRPRASRRMPVEENAAI